MPLTKRDREQRAWLRVRRRARVRLVQALYAWESGGAREPFTRVAERVWDDTALGASERVFARPLAKRLEQRLPQIDAQIARLAHNWRLERIGAIERAVLRLGAAELLAEADESGEVTPPLVAIQEGVLLAERLGSDPSARFVNGVLDALGRALGKIE